MVDSPWESKSPRSKCRLCHRWMTFGTPTEATPAKRRPKPHHDRCENCPPDHYACGCPDKHFDFARKVAETKDAEEELRKKVEDKILAEVRGIIDEREQEGRLSIQLTSTGTRLTKPIVFCGEPVILACDGLCSKAWGTARRPKRSLSADEDDYVYVADALLGEAPTDPGTYEGGDAKPRTPETRLNKWCARQCERSTLVPRGDAIVLPDLAVPRPNIVR